MSPLIVTVLRSGGEYLPEHVYRLKKMLPGRMLYCLSDIRLNSSVVTISLKYDWAGWWSKMELFRPDFVCDWFYVDLDTTITGDISDMLNVGRTHMLSDFYRPERPASGLMYLTPDDRARVWNEWIKDPHGHMARAGTLGDQAFIRTVLGDGVARWQDTLPGQVVSYKVHCREDIPSDARVVCFHGKPRPWAL